MSERDGWPVMTNAGGRFCYYHSGNCQWFLWTEFTPDKDMKNAYIAAAVDGTMPMGAQTWQYFTTEAGWKDQTITASLVT